MKKPLIRILGKSIIRYNPGGVLYMYLFKRVYYISKIEFNDSGGVIYFPGGTYEFM